MPCLGFAKCLDTCHSKSKLALKSPLDGRRVGQECREGVQVCAWCPAGHKGPEPRMVRTTGTVVLLVVFCLSSQGTLRPAMLIFWCGYTVCKDLRFSCSCAGVCSFSKSGSSVQTRWCDCASGTYARWLQQDGQAQQQPYSAPQDSTSSQVSPTTKHLIPVQAVPQAEFRLSSPMDHTVVMTSNHCCLRPCLTLSIVSLECPKDEMHDNKTCWYSQNPVDCGLGYSLKGFAGPHHVSLEASSRSISLRRPPKTDIQQGLKTSRHLP